jgi:hypothetical protein
MRHYATDSPEATARILALALLADGAIDLSELESLQRHKIVGKLGLDSALFDKVVHEFCEDMLSYAHQAPSGRHELDLESIDALLNEIRDPDKRNTLLSSMLNIINAEGMVLASEGRLISQALKVWHLQSRSEAASTALIENRPPISTRASSKKIAA